MTTGHENTAKSNMMNEEKKRKKKKEKKSLMQWSFAQVTFSVVLLLILH